MWWTWCFCTVCAAGTSWWTCRYFRRVLARERETRRREQFRASTELNMLRVDHARLAHAELVTREAAAIVDQALREAGTGSE